MTRSTESLAADWDLWPSVVETNYGDHKVGTQLLIQGRLFDIDISYGPTRPPHCPARHPVMGDTICCALWPGHDGPHCAAGQSYMDEVQFTITGLRTALGGFPSTAQEVD